MVEKLNYNIVNYLKHFSEYSSIIIIIIGILALTGWTFEIAILKSPSPYFSTIKSNAALCFILIGFSLWLQQTKRINKRNRQVAQILVIIVALIGFLTLMEHLFNFNFGIDQILFTEPLGALNTSAPNRMSFITAFELLITGAALLILDKKLGRYRPAQFLMLIEGILALMAFMGYVYSASNLYMVYNYTGTSLYAAIVFIIIFFAVLTARPENGLMKVIVSDGLGSVFGRRILPAVIIFPILLGGLWLLGEKLGYYDFNFGEALLVISTVIILLLILWNTMISLNKTDMDRQKSQKNLERRTLELEEALNMLKRSNEELQQFAYVSSHDLQEPLRTIASFTQLLERRYKGKLDADADEFLDYIVDAAKRMQTLINDLLEYSRVTTKGREFEPVDVNEVLDIVLSNLKISIDEDNAEIIYNELPTVYADELQLVQLFQNLIGNAIKFRRVDEPPKIEISCKKDDDKGEYVFSVTDNGIGIEKQYLERIFIIFQQLHTIDMYKGTGIGLSVAKKIVEHHGGHIWAESKFGVGSTFYFTFPVKPVKMGKHS